MRVAKSVSALPLIFCVVLLLQLRVLLLFERFSTSDHISSNSDSVLQREKTKQHTQTKGNLGLDVDCIQIHVIAWKRHESLRVLLDELNSANYSGWEKPVELRIHIDGGAPKQTLSVAIESTWSHGTKNIVPRTSNMGLRQMWFSSLNPASREAGNNSIFLCFEDDMRVSPFYFQWLLLVMARYGNGTANRNTQLMGFSLSPLKMEELKKPFTRFNAQIAESMKKTNDDGYMAYLSVVPSSWGVAFWSDQWSMFAAFAEIRMRSSYYNYTAEKLHTPGQYDDLQLSPEWLHIPNCRCNVWPGSWKRFLIDYMFARGLVMLYPNLQEERGLATTLALSGDHVFTSPVDWKNPRVAELVETEEQFDLVGLPEFCKLHTLGLHLDESSLEDLKLSGNAFLGNVVRNCSGECGELVRAWAGYDSAIIADVEETSICAPDLYSTVQGSTQMMKLYDQVPGRKYLLYEAEYGGNNQIFSMIQAYIWATALGRHLVIAPVLLPRASDFVGNESISDWPVTSRVLQFRKGVTRKLMDFSIPSVDFVEFAGRNVSYARKMRIARKAAHDESTSVLTRALGLNPINVDLGHLLEGRKLGVAYWRSLFGSCPDEALAFEGMFFSKTWGLDKFEAMNTFLELSDTAQGVLMQVKTNLHTILGSKTYACVHVRKGDFSSMCQSVASGDTSSWYYKQLLEEGYSCYVAETEMVNVLREVTMPLLILSDDIQAIESILSRLPNRHITSREVEIATSQHVANGTSETFLHLYSMLMEQELCARGDLIILNKFSTASRRIEYLSANHKPSKLLHWKTGIQWEVMFNATQR